MKGQERQPFDNHSGFDGTHLPVETSIDEAEDAEESGGAQQGGHLFQTAWDPSARCNQYRTRYSY